MRARNLVRAALLATFFAAACDEQNPFETIPEAVSHGSSQVWELGLEGFPSAFDLPSGQRFFVGPSSIGTSFGTFALTARADGTLAFRAFGTLIPGFSAVRVGIQDLGPLSFDAVTEVPEGGYTASDDSLGVAVVEGHTYAFRSSLRLPNGLLAQNYGKVHVVEIGQQLPENPRSRFIRFEWAYQNQPTDRSVAVEEEPGS